MLRIRDPSRLMYRAADAPYAGNRSIGYSETTALDLCEIQALVGHYSHQTSIRIRIKGQRSFLGDLNFLAFGNSNAASGHPWRKSALQAACAAFRSDAECRLWAEHDLRCRYARERLCHTLPRRFFLAPREAMQVAAPFFNNLRVETKPRCWGFEQKCLEVWCFRKN